MWKEIPKCDLQETDIPTNIPLLGYNKEWIDPDLIQKE